MKSLFLAVMLVFFALSQAVQAEAKQEKLFYEVFYGGFKVAEMRLIAEEEGDKYRYSSIIDSYGIVRRISKYSSENISVGKKFGDKYLPERYESKWKRKEQSQDISLVYSQAGDVIKVEMTPPERKGKRPDVANKFKIGVFDPVVAAFVAKAKVAEELKKDPYSKVKFTLPLFDAKRRFDMLFEIKGLKTIVLDGKQQNLLHVHVSRNPLAGFNARELAEIKGGEGQQIDFYLNDKFVPVFARAKAEMGSATIKLAQFPDN